MFEEYAPTILVAILTGCSGFGDTVVCVESDYSDDIQEIMFLGVFLMWNDAAVCGGRNCLSFFASVCSDIWKSRKRESAMIFSIPLMCWEYRDFSLLVRVHPSQRATASCDCAFIGSKYALCIHPSALELYVNVKMCDPCPRCRMVM